MNKSQLREFAITSRVALIESVKLRAYAFGITEDMVKKNQITPSAQQLNPNGGLLTNEERTQRDELLRQIEQKGFTQVMEEAAYTWFNRFIAIRFMEGKQLLPIRQRVFARKGEVRPELIADALNIEIDGLDRARVIALIESNGDERLYKMQLIALANSLHAVLPQMFEEIDNYTELLFPDGLLQKESVLAKMGLLDEDNWQDIEVVGWLYQYYNTELKDETFALLKKNVKIAKERIGAATQLFTPEWIVRYMVENSMGRLWLEGHKNATLQSGWKYYLPEAEQEPQVAEKLKELRKDTANLRPEEITVLDPCMGSGHILVVAFDVLMGIYRSVGYTDRDAVRSIIENNLYGLDIDDRAAQLAYFAVMMKACHYDKRFLRREDVTQPHVCAIQESNRLAEFDKLRGQLSLDKLCLNTANELIRTFDDAKEYGSILDVQISGLENATALMAQLRAIQRPDFALSMWLHRAEKLLPQLAMQAEIMQRKYAVVVTNPPYMGISNGSDMLNQYAKDHYPVSKNDLSTIFMQKSISMCAKYGIMAMINIPVWMSKSSFEDCRYYFLTNHTFINMLHCGRGIFGSDFGTTTFVIRNRFIESYAATFLQLFEEMGAVDSIEQKEKWFFEKKGRYVAEQIKFLRISSYPIAYSTSRRLLDILNNEKPLCDYAFARKGLTTGDNDTFIRLWFEIELSKFSIFSCLAKWFPMTKGGDFRRWYGNNEYVVNWENDGHAIKNFKDENGKLRSRPQNTQFYLQEGISWNDTTATGKIAFRYQPAGYISNASGPCVFTDNNLMYLFGLLNSIVSQKLLEILAPNMKFEVGQMALVPIIMSPNEDIAHKAQNAYRIARNDWDSFETSWDFQRHPLTHIVTSRAVWGTDASSVSSSGTVERNFYLWQQECENRFQQLKASEEELNRIFIDIYGLQDDLTSEVADKDVTVRRADLARDIRSLISYAVGCMMGRYSLTVPGLAYAGGDWDAGKYSPDFQPDKDGILPIADDEYFDDDIVSRFIRFVEVVYGKDTLEENLRFIADALGGEGKPPKDVIRAYFLNDFYKDHLKVYQKRPIYWLFDSGKQNGFKALVYLHRYDRDTLARMRTDYVHPQQERLRTQIDGENHAAQIGDAHRKAVAAKRLDKLQKQLIELAKFEEQLHNLADERIPIDLDDGVKVNYAKMGNLVQPIQ